ncbi:MAG: hypothetical protein EAZ09_21300 [Oscillatoriales cyanobacterium]|nr:MAG: hypothetical protein EAZ18_17990 [Oscillatoriales cyanobacterium]TAH16532.1 MAG: hypothetical protein EAZ09_21300 [Oscillatoriales cyanobacterium]
MYWFVNSILQVFFDPEFQRWYKPDLSVESIQNLKSKILKKEHLSVGSIYNLKSQISNLKSIDFFGVISQTV